MTSTKHILITGASSGIGAACALHLDRLGYRVLAGVRKEADGAALKERSSDRLTPVNIDVTHSESVANAREAIAEITGDGGLFGLVNNAGIAEVQQPQTKSPRTRAISRGDRRHSEMARVRKGPGFVCFALRYIPLRGPRVTNKMGHDAGRDAARLNSLRNAEPALASGRHLRRYHPAGAMVRLALNR